MKCFLFNFIPLILMASSGFAEAPKVQSTEDLFVDKIISMQSARKPNEECRPAGDFCTVSWQCCGLCVGTDSEGNRVCKYDN